MNKKFFAFVIIAIFGFIIGFIFIFDFIQKENSKQEFSNNIQLETSVSNSKIQYFSDIDTSVDISSTVVITPIFTAAAYAKNGFYDFYRGDCNTSCLTVPIKDNFDLSHATSMNAISLFHKIGFTLITDVELHQNPSLLTKYDKVILLHNEYVTQKEFDAITNHPKVIYLYPNALYAEVNFDEDNYAISLIRGHGYPDASIDNGFDWKYDNTRPYEFDTECKNWSFYSIDNGFMLNCYPENKIMSDLELVKKILEI